MKTKLISKEGGVFSNYYTDYPIDPDDGQNHEILSESIGLYLEYLYLSNRKNEFSREIKFITKYLTHSTGLISWKMKENGDVENSSATIDDFRIIRYLILAGEKWGSSPYIRLAKKIADASLKYCTKNDTILDGASWDKSFFKQNVYRNLNVELPLSYIDLYTIDLISKIDKKKSSKWKKIFDKGLLIIYHGIEKDYFAIKYNVKKKAYTKKKLTDHNILNIITTLHITEINLTPISVINYFKSGKIIIHDVASYGLLIKIFLNLGDIETAKKFLDKMIEFVIPEGPQRGGFGYYMKDKKRYKVYAFDNLLALSALRLYQIHTKER